LESKIFFSRWYPGLNKYAKSNTHRALDDIKESIAELKYYKQHIFKSEAEVRLRPRRKRGEATEETS